MNRTDALLDSNVLMAALVARHEHHAPSYTLLESAADSALAVAAHSYAEAFTTLTRRNGPAPYQREPGEVWTALEGVSARTRLVGLTPEQTLDAVRLYAAAGGIGPRLYDHLIGRAAALAGAGAIVTWNTGHLRSLFPALAVETPKEWLARA